MWMHSLRRLRWRLALLVVVYFFALGAASQELLPDIDEIIPLYGWSLFSKVPTRTAGRRRESLRQRKRMFHPPVPFLHAPETLDTGNRYIGRKVIQWLGRAVERGEADKVRIPATPRTELPGSRVRYELVFERYDPAAEMEDRRQPRISEPRRVRERGGAVRKRNRIENIVAFFQPAKAPSTGSAGSSCRASASLPPIL